MADCRFNSVKTAIPPFFTSSTSEGGVAEFQNSLILLSFETQEHHRAFILLAHIYVKAEREIYLYRTALSAPKAPTIKSRKKGDILHITIYFF